MVLHEEAGALLETIRLSDMTLPHELARLGKYHPQGRTIPQK